MTTGHYSRSQVYLTNHSIYGILVLDVYNIWNRGSGMDTRWIRRILLILLAVVFLSVVLCTTFALTIPTGECSVQGTSICLCPALLQEIAEAIFPTFGLFAILALLHITGRTVLQSAHASTLVFLRTRINN